MNCPAIVFSIISTADPPSVLSLEPAVRRTSESCTTITTCCRRAVACSHSTSQPVHLQQHDDVHRSALHFLPEGCRTCMTNALSLRETTGTPNFRCTHMPGIEKAADA